MAKTITLRVDDDVYRLIKVAAEGDRRSISNYIEYTMVNYITEESFVSEKEMQSYFTDSGFRRNLKTAEKDIEEGRYKVVD